jgi:hypothetical protein
VVHKATRGKWAVDRIKAIIALGGDWTLGEVSEILLLDSETLRNYIKLFEKGGVKELMNDATKTVFSKDQLRELKQHLAENTYLT